MPLYDFQCTQPSCQYNKQLFEALVPVGTENQPCPACKTQAERAVSAKGQSFRFNYFGDEYNA